GLAGCEAAFLLAQNGINVKLYEMKPKHKSPAHKMDGFAELVCSNSLKAARLDSAAGLLKWEMGELGSICVKTALECAVPAGGALAVDREIFSKKITEIIMKHECIEVINESVQTLPQDDFVIIATGPLTEGALAEEIKEICGSEYLNFYDAAAPIISAESIDMSEAFCASRYDKGDDDYINCPFNKERYERFHSELIGAESAILHDFDVYEGCMPIEVLAKRGVDAARFGPMKPVGLRDPNTGHRPWAVVQLRKENKSATMFNLVGFQTNLKFGEQKRVFSMIPGLANAEFLRYGVMHRNSFINSPKLLNSDFSMRNYPNIYFAGQISGVEGYMESASSGMIAGISILRKIKGQAPLQLPLFSMIGALCNYISDKTVDNFQPMGANFGVLPPLPKRIKDKKERYEQIANRSIDWFSKNIK
ncbi:MAG: methylenetetrahydrofolate--tRNA-(uracil(54)-C(5))-methyltransferase (FADH(2)-oxidizing) TrmFO, partial [Oscillospiraceae bacterium]